MTVDGPQVDCLGSSRTPDRRRSARRPGDQRGPYRWRPQYVPASGQPSVPAVDDELYLKARGAVRLQFGGAGLDIEPSCPDAHRVSIGRPAFQVEPVYAFRWTT